MSNIFFQIQKELMPVLRSGDTLSCERVVSERLAALPRSPFHIALELGITNSPADVAEYFDSFFRQEAPRLKIGAALRTA